MLVTRKSLSRRTLLRGLGTAIALPLLDAMSPALAGTVGKRAASPKRLAFVYVPNGIIMRDWSPSGTDFLSTPILEPLAAHRDYVTLFSGLAQMNGRALGDGPGDHARAAASYLTGIHPKKTEGADIRNGISVDQVAAQAVGNQTRFASLELGLEGGGMVGNCDSGYSCAYSNSVSWKSETMPLPPEVNPRAVFERLYGDGEPMDREMRLRLAAQDRSLLDFVQDDTSRLSRTLGANDKRKLDEYLTSVREIERRIQESEKATREGRDQMAAPPFDKPAGIPVTFEEHAHLMFDLMVAAMQSDSTRVITLMMGREGSNRTYRSIGVSEAHHGLSHHMGDEEKVNKLAKINRHHMELFAYLVQKMAATKDNDGALLDNSMVLYGSGLSDGNRHLHHDLPVLLAGRGGGSVKAGRHLQSSAETPMNNLFLSLLDRMGVAAETLGDSTGKLTDLSNL